MNVMKYTDILQQINTPCYVINDKKLTENWLDIYNNFNNCWNGNVILGYSVKTNHFPYMLKWAKDRDMMAEVVSADEYHYALENGFEAENIIFNGPQKAEDVLLLAIKENSIINLDNLDELDILEAHRKELSDSCRIGIRVNFNLEEICKNETTAGSDVSRLGICVENGDFEAAVKRLHALHLKVNGLHMHYSTKSRSINVFEALAEKACKLSEQYNLVDEIIYIDIGGGFFGGRILAGKPTMEEYSDIITTTLKTVFSPDKVKLILEPGASLIATAIDYYCKVRNVREIRGCRVITVDGSTLHINPFMQTRVPEYEIFSSHEMVIGEQVVCGSTCMEMDRFYLRDKKNEILSDTKILFHCTGAYTMTHNSCFINTLPNIYVKKAENEYELLREEDYRHMAL